MLMVIMIGHITLSGLPMLVFGSISLLLWIVCGVADLLKGVVGVLSVKASRVEDKEGGVEVNGYFGEEKGRLMNGAGRVY